MLDKIPVVAKAIVATLTAFGGALTLGLDDGAVTSLEWIQIGITTVVAAAAVWAVPNKPAAERKF